MTIGEKIRLIRTFRNMTQKELGITIGFDEKGANNRIAQYETNYRVPKKDMLYKIAEALKVNSLNFISEVPGSAEDIMQTFFWLDEDNMNAINLFQLVPSANKDYKEMNDTTAMYKESDYWPVTPPVGIWFNYGVVDDFMHDWMEKKEELRKGEITNDEYFEWKLNWPNTCFATNNVSTLKETSNEI